MIWLNLQLQKNSNNFLLQAELLVLDKDWQGVICLLAEKVTRSNNMVHHVTYPQNGRQKMIVAVLELAKRFAFIDKVAVITDEENLLHCAA